MNALEIFFHKDLEKRIRIDLLMGFDRDLVR
jgi:hypothetical protein